jgi:hypothetical protein
MLKEVKEVYELALNDEEFHEALKKDSPEQYAKPNIFWSNDEKVVYAGIYYGYLLGKAQ